MLGGMRCTGGCLTVSRLLDCFLVGFIY